MDFLAIQEPKFTSYKVCRNKRCFSEGEQLPEPDFAENQTWCRECKARAQNNGHKPSWVAEEVKETFKVEIDFVKDQEVFKDVFRTNIPGLKLGKDENWRFIKIIKEGLKAIRSYNDPLSKQTMSYDEETPSLELKWDKSVKRAVHTIG